LGEQRGDIALLQHASDIRIGNNTKKEKQNIRVRIPGKEGEVKERVEGGMGDQYQYEKAPTM